LGDIAFAYTYTHMLVEIQDSIPSSQAHVAMRRANMLASAINTVFSLLCGAVSYAALGDAVPDNLLDGIRTYHADSWLLDVANAAAVVHLAIAYQLGWQPLFALVEQRAQERRWPLSGAAVDVPLYVHGGGRRTYKLNLFRLTCRAALVAATTAASVLLPAPLLKNVLGFLGAICFWPLTVYFPVEMYVVQKQVPRWSARWVCLRMLSLACLAVTVAAGVGYIAGMIVAS
jgi:amino acid permease